MSTLLFLTLPIFEVGLILDFIHSGFIHLDFFHSRFFPFRILSVRDFAQLGIFCVMDFALSGFCPIGILSVLGFYPIRDFVPFGILSNRDFAQRPFSRTCRLRGQGLQNVSSRPRRCSKTHHLCLRPGYIICRLLPSKQNGAKFQFSSVCASRFYSRRTAYTCVTMCNQLCSTV